MVESGCLESSYPEKSGSGVRIPLSPPAYAKASAGGASFLNDLKLIMIVKVRAWASPP